MKTLIKTNEFGTVTKAFYASEQSALDASGSFLRDCTVHRLQREKRSVEIIDFEFSKYGFPQMPLCAQFERNNLGLFVKATFRGLDGNSLISKQVDEL